MKMWKSQWCIATAAVLMLAGMASGQALTPQQMTALDVKIKQLKTWSTDPQIVAAVKAHNTGQSPEELSMTNVKWAKLTLLDPYVRTYTRNQLAEYLKSRKDDSISECFVSGADGTKVAFLSKTTYWSHADKEKHKVPMAGKVYIGTMAMDESTGLKEVQIGLPVLDGGKPIGSLVVGINVSRLR
jgi:hypothetical protein